MKLLVVHCCLLGFSIGFLFFLLWKNDFHISTQSEDFISILVYIFLSISSVAGIVFLLLTNKKLIKKD